MTRWYCLIALLASIRNITGKECNNKEIQVQKPSTPPESNGCSKPSFIQVNGEEDFTYCCDRHDACYGMCNSDKTFCDKDFGNCMRRLCKSNFAHNPECAGAAGTYEMGTMFAGQQGYAESQEQHCICIPKDEVDGEFFTTEESHYMKLVEDFYKKYVTTKDNPKSPEELVTSYSRTKKQPLYRLYYDLHKKYDQAIKHVDGRPKMNPPRPPAKASKSEKGNQKSNEKSSQKSNEKSNEKDSDVKGVKQVPDNEVLDTLGKQFEHRKEFFESQKVENRKQAQTDKEKDHSGKSNKNSKTAAKSNNNKKSRKEMEDIDNDEFNREVQRKIQEIRKRKEQSTLKESKQEL